MGIELPDRSIVPTELSRPARAGLLRSRSLPATVVDAFYEDICAALLFRVLHEIYHILPGADLVEIKGIENSPTRAGRKLKLDFAVDRWTLSRVDLDHVDPSELFCACGGEIEYVEHADSTPVDSAPRATSATTLSAASDERERLSMELDREETRLVQEELELATLKAQLRAFELRYTDLIGRKYAELDKLRAEIAQLLSVANPDDVAATERAREAWEAAQASARAADQARETTPRFQPTESLKKLFRETAKRLHPDLAASPKEREIRTSAMAAANAAYQAGDERALRTIIDEWTRRTGADAGPIISETERLRQRFAAVIVRIAAIGEEITTLRSSPLYELMIRIEREEALGADPLARLADAVNQEIESERARVASIRSELSTAGNP